MMLAGCGVVGIPGCRLMGALPDARCSFYSSDLIWLRIDSTSSGSEWIQSLLIVVARNTLFPTYYHNMNRVRVRIGGGLAGTLWLRREVVQVVRDVHCLSLLLCS